MTSSYLTDEFVITIIHHLHYSHEKADGCMHASARDDNDLSLSSNSTLFRTRSNSSCRWNQGWQTTTKSWKSQLKTKTTQSVASCFPAHLSVCMRHINGTLTILCSTNLWTLGSSDSSQFELTVFQFAFLYHRLLPILWQRYCRPEALVDKKRFGVPPLKSNHDASPTTLFEHYLS